MRETNYPYLRRWCKWVRMSPEQTEAKVAYARATFAPPDAAFETRHGSGVWVKASEVLSRHLRNELQITPKQ